MAGSRSILFIVSRVVFMPLCQSVIPDNIDGGEQGAKDTNQADGKCARWPFSLQMTMAVMRVLIW